MWPKAKKKIIIIICTEINDIIYAIVITSNITFVKTACLIYPLNHTILQGEFLFIYNIKCCDSLHSDNSSSDVPQRSRLGLGVQGYYLVIT